jgi:hypothetical protein
LGSGTISTSALHEEGAAYGFNDLMTAYLAGTAVTVRLSTEVVGDNYTEEDCWISSLEMNSPETQQNVTYSATFTLCAKPTVSAVPQP